VIRALTDEEFVLLEAISSPRILAKDNFRTETISRALPPQWKKDIDTERVCRGLVNKGIMTLYRPGNWKFENLGFQLTHFLRLQKGRKNGLSRIQRRG